MPSRLERGRPFGGTPVPTTVFTRKFPEYATGHNNYCVCWISIPVVGVLRIFKVQRLSHLASSLDNLSELSSSPESSENVHSAVTADAVS